MQNEAATAALNTDAEQASEVLLRLLARREHSYVELARKLQQRGFDPDTSRSVIDQAVTRGWQSDERFMQSFLQERIRQGDGPLKVRAAAQQRGVSSAEVDAALENVEIDWAEQCYEKLLRRFPDQVPLDAKDKNKRMRYLQQRGFSFEHIKSALNKQQETLAD
ncbi:MAG: regulatory protein RecX [Idiomarina sp.]